MVFGYGSAVVVSDSMETAISKGDVIIVHREGSYRQGDVILFADGGDFTTHRIVREENGAYITKGDNNDSEDSPVSQDRVVGKVCTVIPSVGIFLEILSKPTGMIALIIIGIGIIVLPDYVRGFFRKDESATGDDESAKE